MVGAQGSHSKGERMGELPYHSSAMRWCGCRGCALPQGHETGELTLVVWLRKSRQADQLSYQSQIQGSELAPLQSQYHLQMSGTCEKAGPAVPKLQDLCDMGQQQDNQEEAW